MEHIVRSNVAIARGQVGNSYNTNKRQVACRQNHVAQGKDRKLLESKGHSETSGDMPRHPRGKPTDRGKVIWPTLLFQ